MIKKLKNKRKKIVSVILVYKYNIRQQAIFNDSVRL